MLARHNMMALRGGAMDRRSAGAGEKFWQFKPYEQGDRPQDIDWRRSAKGAAKGQDIFIRQKQKQDPQRASFWVATDENMNFASHKNLPSKYEYASVLSLSLMMALAAQGDQITLAGADARLAGHSAYLDHLAALLFERKNKAPTLNDLTPDDIPAKSAFMAAGDFLEEPEKIEASLMALAEKSGAQNNAFIVAQIFDPAELDLPYSGRALFETPFETQGANPDKHDLSNVEQIKKEYQARIENHQTALRQICARYGWFYFTARTDEEITPLLRRLIHACGAR